MKKLLFLVPFAALLSFYQPWKTIKGNGQLKKQTREVSGFTAVDLSGSMNVMVDYGDSKTISVEADENLMDYIETVVDGNTLKVKAKENVNLKTNEKIVVHVSMTKLTGLKLSGSGNLQAKGNFATEGNTELSVRGSGNLGVSGKFFDETTATVSGSGNLFVSGTDMNAMNASVSGSGNIDCSGIVTKTLSASVSGSGNIRADVSKRIDAKISGSGNIFYTGSATDINTKKMGSGRIVKI